MAYVHHVNLGVLPGKVEAESEWLTEVLGCRKIEGPPSAHWFSFDDGPDIHLSEDPLHTAAARFHVAVQFDDVARIQEVLELRQEEIRTEERRSNGLRYVFCADPSGNKWELRSPLTGEPTEEIGI
jgi:catechol 2,3-dioxygenase-like lactoylglutathione lyase family enzyme